MTEMLDIVYETINQYVKVVQDRAIEFENKIDELEAELMKFRRLDMAWAEEVKEQDLKIANLKEELGHLHSRFDRILDDVLQESE